tara:strand:- start:2933 stop:3370 length:438 start_codon:yes stop_codon:yes gene_type:complete
MNSQLHDNQYKIPVDILKHLNETLKTMSNVKGEGMKRLRRLVTDRVMTYQQLKRLIYDFKNINKEENPDSFNLNGGQKMYEWANSTLNNARKEIEQQKKSARRAADLTPGKKNAYRKSHEKNGVVPSVDVSRLSENIKRYHKLIK